MNQRGITLIELMIVVAIIAVLAAIGSIAYGRYVKSAKIKKLEQHALEVQAGQERYRSRNNTYWAGGTYAADKTDFVNLLDFNPTLEQGVEVETVGWSGDPAGACGFCQGQFDGSVAGYGVRVSQDMDNQGEPNTTIILTHMTPGPILLNEGQ